MGFPGGSDSKEPTCNVGDLGLIPGLGRSPGGRHGSPLQYSYLENPYGQRILEGYSPWGHKESDTTEWLSTTPSNHHDCQHQIHKPVMRDSMVWTLVHYDWKPGLSTVMVPPSEYSQSTQGTTRSAICGLAKWLSSLTYNSLTFNNLRELLPS